MSGEKHLQGRTALVTGAAGILCSHMVESLLENGARVVLLGRTGSKLDKLAGDMAAKGLRETFVVEADVLDLASLQQARARVAEKWGSVSILVNGAGGNHPDATTKIEKLDEGLAGLEDSFFRLKPDAFDSVYDLNFKGTLLPCQVFGEGMAVARYGQIINISSMSALRPLTKIAAYSAAKAAVDNITRWLAVHLAPCGVRVNALAPGFFVTEQNRFLLYKDGHSELSKRGEKILAGTPLNRFGRPEDLRTALEFLLHPNSSFVTGVVLPVDGGFSAYAGV